MAKTKFIYILASLILNFTAVYIISSSIRALYNKPYNTQALQIIDSFRIKLDTIPLLAVFSIGIAIGILFMAGWEFLGYENKRR